MEYHIDLIGIMLYTETKKLKEKKYTEMDNRWDYCKNCMLDLGLSFFPIPMDGSLF